MNRWGIPPALEQRVIARDSACIYCGVPFVLAPERRGDRPTWEHIVNDARMVDDGNIARCCASCNASKGARTLTLWLTSAYCRQRGISECTIAPVAREAWHRMNSADSPSPAR